MFILWISMCLLDLMKFYHCLFKILKKDQNMADRKMDGRVNLYCSNFRIITAIFSGFRFFQVLTIINEPCHEKTCFCHMRTTKVHKQFAGVIMTCVPSEDSDQPDHLPSLTSLTCLFVMLQLNKKCKTRSGSVLTEASPSTLPVVLFPATLR